MMIAAAIVAQTSNDSPATETRTSYVHLGGRSLSGTHRAMLITATPEQMDAIEADPACVLLLRFAAVDDDGNPTMAELDTPDAELLARFNAFGALIGLPAFPTGTTARQILAAMGIEFDRYSVGETPA